MQFDFVDFRRRTEVDAGPFVAVGLHHPRAREARRWQQIRHATTLESNRNLRERPVSRALHLQLYAQLPKRLFRRERQVDFDDSRRQKFVVSRVFVRVGIDSIARSLARQTAVFDRRHLPPSLAIVGHCHPNPIAVRRLRFAIGHRPDQADFVGLDRRAVPRIFQPRVAAHHITRRPVVAVDCAFALSLWQLTVRRRNIKENRVSRPVSPSSFLAPRSPPFSGRG